MASDEFDEAEEEAQTQEDYSSRIFNPEPVDKDKWEPHEAIVNYVNRHYSKMFSDDVKSVIKDEVGVPDIKIFLVPEINPQIPNSEKVQANKTILEGDNRVINTQEFILSACFPLYIKLWQSTTSSDEDLEAEEVLDRVQQSLFCMGSAFAGLNLHRKKIQICAAKRILCGDVEFCSRQKLNPVSSVCSQRGKSHCRQKIMGISGQPGMDTVSSSVSGIAKRSWLF